MAPSNNAPLRERLTFLETELPHVRSQAATASHTASKAAREVESLQSSLSGLSLELKQMREMLRRYLQIGSMLATACVLKTTSAGASDFLSAVAKALAYALRHAF